MNDIENAFGTDNKNLSVKTERFLHFLFYIGSTEKSLYPHREALKT